MYDFKGIFTFEMANNHQGILEHGINIIREMAQITQKYKIRGAVKLQFRHYDTFIHPDSKNDNNNKHVKRFLSTRLTDNEHKILIDEIKKNGLISMVTPFDEKSV